MDMGLGIARVLRDSDIATVRRTRASLPPGRGETYQLSVGWSTTAWGKICQSQGWSGWGTRNVRLKRSTSNTGPSRSVASEASTSVSESAGNAANMLHKAASIPRRPEWRKRQRFGGHNTRFIDQSLETRAWEPTRFVRQ